MQETIVPTQEKRAYREKLSVGLPGLLASMEAAGYTDETLGLKLGKTSRTIQAWRLGHAAPATAEMWRTLAATLNTTVDALLKK